PCEGGLRPDDAVAGQDEAAGTQRRPPQRLEEGHRDAQARSEDRAVRADLATRNGPMGLKKFRPITPTLRHTVMPDYSELTRSRPVRSLTERIYKTGGRDNYGHVSMRWISGGHKQRYRIIDFRRDKDGIAARVASIEYDPNRSARIALLHY